MPSSPRFSSTSRVGPRLFPPVFHAGTAPACVWHVASRPICSSMALSSDWKKTEGDERSARQRERQRPLAETGHRALAMVDGDGPDEPLRFAA